MRDPLLDPETYETDFQRARRRESEENWALIPCYDCGGTMADCGCYVMEDLSGFAISVLTVAGVMLVGAATVVGSAIAVASKLRARR